MAVSGLETLPPDQRAVLQLILVQGRGYADLAATLKLDSSAVRERAHAAADALDLDGQAGMAEVDPATRARVVDYLLGQQDAGERLVTYAELSDAPAACRWAQSLRERLGELAHEELPEVPTIPADAVTNGTTTRTSAAAALAAPPAPVPAVPSTQAPVAPTPAPSVPAPIVTTRAEATPAPAEPSAPMPAADGATAPPAPPAHPDRASEPSGPRPSRLGGALLIAGAAALAIVLAIVLLGGSDDSDDPPASTNQAQTQTTPARTSTDAASRQATAAVVAQVNLTATDGGDAIGIGLVQRAANGRRAIAIQAQRLPANGAQEIYAVWLQGTAAARFLGFVPRQVRAGGSFTVTAPMPRNASAYSTVLVTREGTTAVPTAPGTAILSGALRLS